MPFVAHLVTPHHVTSVSLLRTPQRSTTQTLLLLVGTGASGLASRRDPAVFPAFIVLYAGDVLRASMVFWLLALLRPHGDRKTLGATSDATWWAWYSRR